MRFRLLIAALGLITAAVSAAQAPSAPLARWDFSQAEVAGDIITVPDLVGSNTLRLPKLGASLVRYPDARGAKSVFFDGTSQESGVSTRMTPALTEVRFALTFFPDPSSTQPLQTVAVLFNCFELRYRAERSEIEFIVWDTNRQFYTVRVPVTPGSWNEVVGLLDDGRISVSCGDQQNTVALPSSAVFDFRPGYFRAGFLSNRPFRGAIADISIGQP